MKKKKIKTVYMEDTGETVYSMSMLEGRTPEQQEEFHRRRKANVAYSRREKGAMIKAAFTVYGPVLLCVLGSFFVAALLMYWFLA